VARLWNVEGQQHSEVDGELLQNLKTMTKVEALRQAQLNLIRGNVNSDLLARRGIDGVGKLKEARTTKSLLKSPPQDSISVSTSHPYFWAPFILGGGWKMTIVA
jgi:CHAT domain-containing protein